MMFFFYYYYFPDLIRTLVATAAYTPHTIIMGKNKNIAYTSLIKFLCIFSSLNHEVGIWFQL